MRIRVGSIALALTALSAAAHAQFAPSPTYYYCWAYESDGNRLWVSPVRYGDSNNYTQYSNDFNSRVRNAYNVKYFSASRCGPYNETLDPAAVEAMRGDFIFRERNSYSKNVIPF